jgi:hypothetical protein
MADVLAPAIADRSGLEAAACKDVPLRVTLYNSAVIDPAPPEQRCPPQFSRMALGIT